MQPPSTGTIDPVMDDDASEARNSATAATSAGWAWRLSSCRAAARSRPAVAAAKSSSLSVGPRRPRPEARWPGRLASTGILAGPWSTASWRVRSMIAPVDAQ